MIRARDRGQVTVPAEVGEPVEVRVQGYALRAEAGAEGATFTLPPLHFGNRLEIVGQVWREKSMTKLTVERV